MLINRNGYCLSYFKKKHNFKTIVWAWFYCFSSCKIIICLYSFCQSKLQMVGGICHNVMCSLSPFLFPFNFHLVLFYRFYISLCENQTWATLYHTQGGTHRICLCSVEFSFISLVERFGPWKFYARVHHFHWLLIFIDLPPETSEMLSMMAVVY